MRYHLPPHAYHPHVVRPVRRGRDVMSIQNLINHDEDTAVQSSTYTAPTPTPTVDIAHPKKSTFSLRPITAAGWKVRHFTRIVEVDSDADPNIELSAHCCITLYGQEAEGSEYLSKDRRTCSNPEWHQGLCELGSQAH